MVNHGVVVIPFFWLPLLLDRWMDGRGRTNGRMDKQKNGKADRQTDGRTDGRSEEHLGLELTI